MNVNIKYLVDAQQHIPKLAQWNYEEWNKYDPTLTVDRVAASLKQRLNKDKIPLVLIALVNEDLAGVVSLKDHIRIPGYEDRDLWLGNLIVAKNYRSHGVGRLLLKHAYDKARELGFKKISLFTTVPEAIDWYIKNGLTQFAVDTYHGNPAWLFEYSI